MTPTMVAGRHMLAWRLGSGSRHWEHGDVVLVERAGAEPLLRRVVGWPATTGSAPSTRAPGGCRPTGSSGLVGAVARPPGDIRVGVDR